MTAGYSVEIAKIYGINAAIMISKIAFLQNVTPRKDGFCWRTQSELYEETGLTFKMQRNAMQVLVDAGLLEVKNTMIIGTTIKCRHYKLTDAYFKQFESDDEPDDSDNDQADPHHEQHEANTQEDEACDELFGRFWNAYPRKVDKRAARKVFEEMTPTEEDVDRWVRTIELQAETTQWSNPQSIPSPSMWLRGKNDWTIPNGDIPITVVRGDGDVSF